MTELAPELQAAGHGDLASSLTPIEGFVRRWWADNLMPWFTDHGPNHSLRVAQYAMQIAKIPFLPPGLELSTLERYVLWASAWLHDLGMQSLLGRPLGPMTPEVQAEIRHQHPDQTASVILEQAALIGLPSDVPLVQMVAYVARAHGTEFFEASCGYLRAATHVRNERVRGPLLAAILLMADELDLHYQRAQPSLAHPTLNHVSEAHALKHRHVLSCRVEHGRGGVVRFVLTTQALNGFPERDALEIEQWIVHKLRRQIAMVEDEFSGGFGSHAHLSRVVEVTRVPAVASGTVPDARAMALIRADNARARMLNHGEGLAHAVASAGAREPVAILGPLDEAFVDLCGREDLLDVIEAELASQGSLVLASRRMFDSFGSASVDDVLAEWEAAIPATSSQEAPCEYSRAERIERLIAGLAGLPGRLLVTVSSIDRLGDREQEWLAQTVLKRMRDELDASVVVTGDTEVSVGAERFGLLAVPTAHLDRAQVARDLQACMKADDAEDAAAADIGYAGLKRLRDRHLFRLAGVST